MFKNVGDMMKQAQKVQAKLAEIQEGLKTKTVEASSGGGMVAATVNGNLRLVKIKIDPAVVNPSDVEMLEDLVIAAINEATKRASEMVSEEMGKVTAGFGIPPGLF